MSSFGDSMFGVAVMLWVSQHVAAGQSWMPAACGGVTACGYVSAVLAAPAVQLADRHSPRAVMKATEIARLAVTITVTLLASLPAAALPAVAWLAVIYLAAGTLTGAGQVFTAARMAAVRDIAPVPEVAKHAAAAAAASSTAAILGSALSGPVTILAGPHVAFAVDAVTYLLSWTAVRRLPSAPHRPGPETDGFGLRAALAVFREAHALTSLVRVTCTCQLGTGTLTALAVVTVTTNLHAHPASYGLLDAVLGAGSIAGAVTAVRLASRVQHRTLVVAGLAAAAAALAGYAWCRNLPEGIAVLAVYWTAIGTLVTATEPVLVAAAPEGALCRSMAVFQTSNQAAAAVSVVLSGALASGPLRNLRPAGGGPATIVLTAGAALVLLAALTAARQLPRRLNGNPAQSGPRN